jgi:hypothetical protein
VRKYVRLMRRGRQNVFWASPLAFGPSALVRTIERPGEPGRYDFDFSRFDRLVRIVLDEGGSTIEGGHLAGRKEWAATLFRLRTVWVRDSAGRTKRRLEGPATSPESERYLAQLLPALRAHLERRGWLGRYMQHLADEPIPANAADFVRLSTIVRKHMPGVPLVDAVCSVGEVTGSLDIWVPSPRNLAGNEDEFRRMAGETGQLWFYTCCVPGGRHLNRFLDFHLLKTRLLHWANYRYGLTGYLHWGLNQWRDHREAFTKSVRGKLPAGDTHIVYPGPRGPLSSVRFEAMREGIEDYELLMARPPGAARERIAREVLTSWRRYTTNVARFRRVWMRLIEA